MGDKQTCELGVNTSTTCTLLSFMNTPHIFYLQNLMMTEHTEMCHCICITKEVTPAVGGM